mgnify:CR=1 FL=1
MATRGLARMLSTSFAVSCDRSAASTTRLIRPCAFASSALMKAPVTSISNAALRPRLRLSATLGVLQNRPRLTPLTAKRASRTATARSHMATSWQPAAVAMPCTCAITGTGNCCSASMKRLHCANRRW